MTKHIQFAGLLLLAAVVSFLPAREAKADCYTCIAYATPTSYTVYCGNCSQHWDICSRQSTNTSCMVDYSTWPLVTSCQMNGFPCYYS